MLKSLTTALVMTALCTSTANAHHTGKLRSVSGDKRIKTVAFNPDKIVNVKGHYRYATAIEFAKNEAIQGVVLGDATAWEASPARNMLFLKPVLENPDTNMTVMTNRRTYQFQLSAYPGYAKNPSNAIHRVRFTYPKRDKQRMKDLYVNGKAGFAVNPDQLNFDYTYAGSKDIKPTRVFDDGTFTYLQFKPGTDLPAIFMVNKDGDESLVNFKKKNKYIVVPTVGRRFSLRNGKETLCLFNEPLFTEKD